MAHILYDWSFHVKRTFSDPHEMAATVKMSVLDNKDCDVKVKVGNTQEMAQSERNSHSKNRGGEN